MPLFTEEEKTEKSFQNVTLFTEEKKPEKSFQNLRKLKNKENENSWSKNHNIAL